MSLKPFSESINEFSEDPEKTQVFPSSGTPSQENSNLQPFSDGILYAEKLPLEASSTEKKQFEGLDEKYQKWWLSVRSKVLKLDTMMTPEAFKDLCKKLSENKPLKAIQKIIVKIGTPPPWRYLFKYGGEGSGFFGHKGRPGEQGGSASEGSPGLLKKPEAKAQKILNKKIEKILKETTFEDIAESDITETISKLETGDVLEEWETEYLQIGWPKLFGKVGETFKRPSQRKFMNPSWVTKYFERKEA